MTMAQQGRTTAVVVAERGTRLRMRIYLSLVMQPNMQADSTMIFTGMIMSTNRDINIVAHSSSY
jgi:hypothetical protein